MFSSQLDEKSLARLVANIDFLTTRDGITTSQKLSDKCGLSVNSINRLRRGEMDAPTVNTLRALADAFDVYWPLLIDLDMSKAAPDALQPELYTALMADLDFDRLKAKTKALADTLAKDMYAAMSVSENDEVSLEEKCRSAAKVSAAFAMMSDFPRDRADKDTLTIALIRSI